MELGSLPGEVLHEQTRANTSKILFTTINVNSPIYTSIGRRELQKVRFDLQMSICKNLSNFPRGVFYTKTENLIE